MSESNTPQEATQPEQESILRDKIEAELRTVFDPEIPVNIYELGLVYEIKIGDDGNVKITMTLTAPACPVAGEIINEVKEKVEALPDVMDCHVNLTFDPPWNKDMMSEEAKLELGFL
jgi:FeS assembly SUF system protein